MTPRRKTAWGFGISGIVSIAVGVIFYTTAVTPDWVPLVLAIIGAVAPMIGIKISIPKI
ncbi:hypothetical protein LCGC14_1852420 [marine sediment metagenome]|uniref:Uncharacterized protein n=1 Tax=marine sediment metagenome TaxID=412755 RepID=A0A0F9G9V7_9ZZZZ